MFSKSFLTRFSARKVYYSNVVVKIKDTLGLSDLLSTKVRVGKKHSFLGSVISGDVNKSTDGSRNTTVQENVLTKCTLVLGEVSF